MIKVALDQEANKKGAHPSLFIVFMFIFKNKVNSKTMILGFLKDIMLLVVKGLLPLSPFGFKVCHINCVHECLPIE